MPGPLRSGKVRETEYSDGACQSEGADSPNEGSVVHSEVLSDDFRDVHEESSSPRDICSSPVGLASEMLSRREFEEARRADLAAVLSHINDAFERLMNNQVNRVSMTNDSGNKYVASAVNESDGIKLPEVTFDMMDQTTSKMTGPNYLQNLLSPRASTSTQYNETCVGELNDCTFTDNKKKVREEKLSSGAIPLTALMARQTTSRDLPFFDGSPLEWPAFKAQYEVSTTTCELSDAENLMRLQRSLKGKAKEAVSGLLLYPTGVGEAMETLEEQFGRPEIIILGMLEKVKCLPRLSESPSSEELNKFGVTIKNFVSVAGQMKKEFLNIPGLLGDLVNKLPAHMKSWWMASQQGRDNRRSRDLADFSLFLKEACDLHLSCAAEKYASAKTSYNKQIVYNVQSETKIKKCLFCGQQHKLYKCKDFLKLSVDDRWATVRKFKLCFRCIDCKFSIYHKCKIRCNMLNCSGGHNNCLHKDHVKENNVSESSYVANTYACSTVALKIVPVNIKGSKCATDTYALLDEGSTVTLIDNELAKMIGVNGELHPLKIHGARGMCANENKSRKVSLTVNNKFKIGAHTVSKLLLPAQQYCVNKTVKMVVPQLLLGQDNASLIVTREINSGSGDSIHSRTLLGWTTHGKVTVSNANNNTSSVYTVGLVTHIQTQDDVLIDMLKKHYAIDSLGVTGTARVNKIDARAEEILSKTTKQLEDGYYETGLLWKNNNIGLPDNKKCALNRLYSLERKLEKDSHLAGAYNDKINEYLDKGYAREISNEELKVQNPRRWYLPHFPVFNVNKPGKLRIVFDAASKCQGISLNDTLLSGPDLLASLMGCLVRFREGPVAVSADIREMFLRVKIKPEDQQSQLFLWRHGKEHEIKTFLMTSMIFGATCSPTSAQYVRNKIAEDVLQNQPETARSIKENFYMDDYLESFNCENSAQTTITRVYNLLKRGQFELTNWASNKPAILEKFPAHLKTSSTVDIIRAQNNEKVLGVSWDPKTDQFVLKFDNKCKFIDVIPTKRQLLSSVMELFDPMGFLTCVTVKAKILLQEVFRSNIEWDQSISDSQHVKWRNYLQLIRDSSCSIPRCVISDKNTPVVLHIFCDASETACCAVAYMTQKTDTEISVSFIASKGKVAPLKPLSIPRLELQAALMGARLAATIKRESTCNIERAVYWTDSTTVLQWIKSDPRNHTSFVANRLGEIDELTEATQWKWVASKWNPADMGTRDVEPPDVTSRGLWFCGPSFLSQSESSWPQQAIKLKMDNDRQELKNIQVNVNACTEVVTQSLPDIKRFSKLNRLIRTTAWIKRFVNRCMKKGHRGETLSADEINEAEMLWIQQCQNDSFTEDIEKLKRKLPLSKKSRLYKLNPMYENNTLRMMSRMYNAQSIPMNIRAPIILDGSHPFAKFIIKRAHEQCLHGGTERTGFEIRKNFWIIHLRSSIRHIIHKCVKCRLARKAADPPQMGEIPEARLACFKRPFSQCGIDMFGPLYVTVGRRREKRYGVIMTCMTTRAIHLELSANISADSTIMAIRRMAARRGWPETMHSDNGTNFHGAEKELCQAMKKLETNVEFQNELANRNVKWAYISSASPHKGGAWERMIRSVKNSLHILLKDRAPREETLQTVFTEIEYAINSRPLTHVTVDAEDDMPLTPNHILMGANFNLPVHTTNQENTPCLRSQWKFAQTLADQFWRRWVNEYLPTLAQRQKWHEKADPLQIGDIVVIADPKQQRNYWPKGIITEATPSKDGQVRTVKVKTSSGEYTRPSVKIILLKRR
jgi:hypothetical protein